MELAIAYSLKLKKLVVIHSGENLSNHSAINVKILLRETEIKHETPCRNKVVSWAKATDDANDNFRSVLEEHLCNINLPGCINCTDVDCSEHEHRFDIENYTMNVLEAVEKSGHHCLPFTSSSNNGKPRKGILPGWNEYVKPYAEDNMFWNSIWRSEGKPRFGFTYEKMRYSKNQYSYAVRRLKKCNDSIQNSKFLEGIFKSERIFGKVGENLEKLE